MRELRTEIEIAAPVEKVWSILTTFNHWKDWNPLVREARGSASAGSDLTIVMRGKNDKDTSVYNPVVTKSEPPVSFRWRASMVAEFLFTNDKVFELKETDAGTLLIHAEYFRGLLVPLFWARLNEGALPMLKIMNRALKKYAEKAS